MSKRATITAHIHLNDETAISSSTLQDGSNSARRYVEALHLGGPGETGIAVFVASREQSERLLDAVSELCLRWREHQPEQVTVDAVIAPRQHPDSPCSVPACILRSGHDAAHQATA